MSEENPTPEETAAAEAKAKALADAEAKAEEENATRTGKGTRLVVKQTRGRSTQIITYEGFDEKQPDTLPKTLSEFMEVSKVSDEKVIVDYLIEGFNTAAYDAAADPVLAFVEKSWSKDVTTQFRMVIRNYSNALNMSIEDSVALIKPGFVAGLVKAGKAVA